MLHKIFMLTLGALAIFLLGIVPHATQAKSAEPQGDPFFWEKRHVSDGAFIESFRQCSRHGIKDANCLFRILPKEYLKILMEKEGFPKPPSGDLATDIELRGVYTEPCIGSIESYYFPHDGGKPRTWTRSCVDGEEKICVEGFGCFASLWCGNILHDPDRVAMAPPPIVLVESIPTPAPINIEDVNPLFLSIDDLLENNEPASEQKAAEKKSIGELAYTITTAGITRESSGFCIPAQQYNLALTDQYYGYGVPFFTGYGSAGNQCFYNSRDIPHQGTLFIYND